MVIKNREVLVRNIMIVIVMVMIIQVFIPTVTLAESRYPIYTNIEDGRVYNEDEIVKGGIYQTKEGTSFLEADEDGYLVKIISSEEAYRLQEGIEEGKDNFLNVNIATQGEDLEGVIIILKDLDNKESIEHSLDPEKISVNEMNYLGEYLIPVPGKRYRLEQVLRNGTTIKHEVRYRDEVGETSKEAITSNMENIVYEGNLSKVIVNPYQINGLPKLENMPLKEGYEVKKELDVEQEERLGEQDEKMSKPKIVIMAVLIIIVIIIISIFMKYMKKEE